MPAAPITTPRPKRTAHSPCPSVQSGGNPTSGADHAFPVPVYCVPERAPTNERHGVHTPRSGRRRDAYATWSFADGICPLDWRQGLKHDAAAVMELTRDPVSSHWRNRHGHVVDVEADFVYPLVKGTDLTRRQAIGPSERFWSPEVPRRGYQTAGRSRPSTVEAI